MDKEFSLKELYDVSIKTTQNMKIGDYEFEKGETVASFDKIQLANFNEIRKVVTANGGEGNEPHVWWETVKDVQLTFQQGIFNKLQLALLTNAKLLQSSTTPIYLPKREQLALDEKGQVITSKQPSTPLYVYDIENSTKCNYSVVSVTESGAVLQINDYDKNEVIVDYYEKFDDTHISLMVGQQVSNTYFSLIGKSRVKEDGDGATKTVIIHIPQLKLMSDLSMRLGQNAQPVIGSMYALACPYGEKKNKYCMELIYLNEDIDADM